MEVYFGLLSFIVLVSVSTSALVACCFCYYDSVV